MQSQEELSVPVHSENLTIPSEFHREPLQPCMATLGISEGS